MVIWHRGKAVHKRRQLSMFNCNKWQSSTTKWVWYEIERTLATFMNSSCVSQTMVARKERFHLDDEVGTHRSTKEDDPLLNSCSIIEVVHKWRHYWLTRKHTWVPWPEPKIICPSPVSDITWQLAKQKFLKWTHYATALNLNVCKQQCYEKKN